jgi:hypothetical protein
MLWQKAKAIEGVGDPLLLVYRFDVQRADAVGLAFACDLQNGCQCNMGGFHSVTFRLANDGTCVHGNLFSLAN